MLIIGQTLGSHSSGMLEGPCNTLLLALIAAGSLTASIMLMDHSYADQRTLDLVSFSQQRNCCVADHVF